MGKLIDFVIPWLRSYAENKYLSYKERKRAILIERYTKTREFYRRPVFRHKIRLYSGFISYLIVFTLLILSIPGLMTRNDWMRTPIVMSYYGFATYVVVTLSNDLITLRNFLYFDKYKEKTVAKIKNLGGNPEDLNKDEIA